MLQCDPDEFDESDFDDFDDDVEPSLREDLIFSSNVVESQLVDSGSPFVEPQTENQNHKSGPAEDFFDLPALCKEIYRQKGIVSSHLLFFGSDDFCFIRSHHTIGNWTVFQHQVCWRANKIWCTVSPLLLENLSLATFFSFEAFWPAKRRAC